MSLSVTTTLAPYGPATAIVLSEAQVATLGGGKRAPVVVTVRGRSARLRLASMGGDLVIGISRANRDALGVEIGEEITATIVLDTAERTVEVPTDLQRALEEVEGASEAFGALTYTLRKELAAGVATAKRAETRQRRIANVLASLGHGAPQA